MREKIGCVCVCVCVCVLNAIFVHLITPETRTLQISGHYINVYVSVYICVQVWFSESHHKSDSYNSS